MFYICSTLQTGKAATLFFLPIIITNRTDNKECTFTKPILEKKNQKANNGEGKKYKKLSRQFCRGKTFEFKIVTLLPSWQAGC